MKRTFLDRLVGYVSPQAELSRMRAKIAAQTPRSYDVAQTFGSSDWVSATSGSANTEVKAALAPGRKKARALAQNAPFATKAIDVIVGEVVGAGIIPNIKAKNKKAEKELKKLWKEWAETPLCDFEGRQNYYALQELAMRETVESGEGLALKKFENDGVKIHIIDSDFIDTTKDSGNIKQGIEIQNFKRARYHLYKNHPGESGFSNQTMTVPSEEVVHVFRQKRAGQLRGVTWAHAVVEKMKDFDDYDHAMVIRQKIAACFGGAIKTNGQNNIDPATLKEKREAALAMEPNTWWFLGPDEELQLITPPGVDGYKDFSVGTLRAIAAGWGITYESMTGDYSQTNYSSSKSAKDQMRKNLDSWRWNMFIPQFCEPTFKWFLEWASMRGIDTKGVTAQWVPPAYTYVDPTKDVPAMQKEVRSGFKSWGEAVRELGRDPDQVLEEIKEWNEKFDAAGVKLDVDPRHMSQAGQFQANPESQSNQDVNSEEENNSEEQDDKDASEESTSGSNQ